MNALPSMITLDFCEWLKNHATQHDKNYADIFDLIFNDEYSGHLRRLAKEYLQGGRNFLRGLLHQFIDSEEFEECCCENCYPYNFEKWNYYPETLRHLLHHCYHRLEDGPFDSFINRYCNENTNHFLYKGKIEPKALADSVKVYFDYHRDEPFIMNLLTNLCSNISLEIDFLEWLILNKGKPMNLNKMPLSLFKDIVDEYCDYAHLYSSDKQKLIKAFKQSDTVSLGKKLVAVLTCTRSEKMKSLGYIYDRYSSKKVPFRCFFLPLASDEDAFEKFIKKYWYDLDAMSGDYLDIYYSEEDYGKSGYAIREGMRMIPANLPGRLPCLVIWQDNLQYAQAIDIEGLSDKEIVRLISELVDLIKAGNTLQTILKETNKMAEQVKQINIENKRPITNNTFNVENNTGIVTGYVENSSVIIYSGAITNNQFENETEKAIEIVNSFVEVEKEYKDALISLIKEANIAIQSRNDKAKDVCKSRFQGFMLGAGKVVGSIITRLSELATIAGFFAFIK